MLMAELLSTVKIKKSVEKRHKMQKDDSKMPDKNLSSKHEDKRMRTQPDPTVDHGNPSSDEEITPDKSAPRGYLKNKPDKDLDESYVAEKAKGEGPGNEVEKKLAQDPDKNEK